MLCERRVKVKFNLTLLQPFTNVVITLCASWVPLKIVKLQEKQLKGAKTTKSLQHIGESSEPTILIFYFCLQRKILR